MKWDGSLIGRRRCKPSKELLRDKGSRGKGKVDGRRVDHDRWARAPMEPVVKKLYANETFVHLWILLEAFQSFLLWLGGGGRILETEIRCRIQKILPMDGYLPGSRGSVFHR